ncbi:hypothetical protein [Streptomyces cyaneofuscatus]|uniref:hypothetical protein n=1 Tax=Streptomyces cyaneofuscatus TaxID=66883 RepID=UPI0036633E36
MNETAQMTGGPVEGQHIELHPVQDQSRECGVLVGRSTRPDTSAYLRDELGQWIWQGKPWPTD